MVSPELLRRYPFFAGLTEVQLRAISMLSQQETFGKGKTFFEECDPAKNLYLLMEGNVDLYYRSVDEMSNNPAPPKEYFAGSVNPGEIFGISALIEPHNMNTTAKASVDCRVIVMDGDDLRKLIDEDLDLSNKLLKQTIKALMERLIAVRVQLVAAHS